MRRRGLKLALGVLVGTLWGCTTLTPPPLAGRQGNGFVFQDSWGSEAFALPPGAVQQALRDAMIDLKMRSLHHERAGPCWVLDASAQDGRHVHALVQSTANGSLVAIRVGRFGDKALAQALSERVGVRLGTRPPSVPPDIPPTTPRPGWFTFHDGSAAAILSEQTGPLYQDVPRP